MIPTVNTVQKIILGLIIIMQEHTYLADKPSSVGKFTFGDDRKRLLFS